MRPRLFVSALGGVLAILLCWPGALLGQEPFTLEDASAAAFHDLPDVFQKILDPRGVRLATTVNGQPTTVLELWWCKDIPVAEHPGKAAKSAYGQLMPGSLLGVLHFPPDTPQDFREDFRDQKLAPGLYTLRYAQLPADAAHQDVAAFRDFLLLSPLAADTDSQPVATEELLRLSRQASRSAHPAVLSMAPANPAYKQLPAAIADDAGQCTLQIILHTKAGETSKGELTVAVVVVTPKKESGES